SLSLVEHKSATSGRYYVHFGVVQSAKDIGLSLDQNFPIEIPGLQNGLRFTFATRRTPPAADPNSLEPEPANWQLDILLDRFAIAFPVLSPASLAAGGPSEPAHLVRSSAPGPSKIYGKGVLRIESVDGAVHFNIVTHADPFRPDGPLGAVLEVGLS